MACGCQVFSSVNGALADYLDPGFNCEAIGTYSTAYDVERILAALRLPRCRHCRMTFLIPIAKTKLCCGWADLDGAESLF
jgi:hypothetical protein